MCECAFKYNVYSSPSSCFRSVPRSLSCHLSVCHLPLSLAPALPVSLSLILVLSVSLSLILVLSVSLWFRFCLSLSHWFRFCLSLSLALAVSDGWDSSVFRSPANAPLVRVDFATHTVPPQHTLITAPTALGVSVCVYVCLYVCVCVCVCVCV